MVLPQQILTTAYIFVGFKLLKITYTDIDGALAGHSVQIILFIDSNGKPTLTGKKKQNVSLPNCVDKLHGAAFYDLGSLWLLLKVWWRLRCTALRCQALAGYSLDFTPLAFYTLSS